MANENQPGTEEKVQTLEGGEVIFPNPHFDMTGSGITFTIYSGLPSGEPPTGDSGPIFGRGGFVAPASGAEITFLARSGDSRRA